MTQKAYTLGRTSLYDEALKEPAKKCIGGWAFKTITSALKFRAENTGVDFGDFVLDDTFSIYQIELPNSWDQDTEYGDDRAYHLLVPAPLSRCPSDMRF